MALPSGYKRLLYIRSSGTQYINTEFNPKYNTRVVMKISDVDTSVDNQWFFGARDGTTASVKNRFTLYKIGETVRSDYFGTSVTVDVSDFTGSTTLDKNGNVASVYGETITNTAVSSGACAYPLFLFVLNNAGKPHSNYASYSLESCQIYDKGTLVRDFIPCKNASGTVGLWDDVNSKFYANAGSGTFTAGPEVGGGSGDSTIAPAGDHNTNIGNVAREVEGGTSLIGGVLREIESGLVLIGGVSREVPFDDGVCRITFLGADAYGEYESFIEINGTVYNNYLVGVELGESFPNSMELESGTKIYILAAGKTYNSNAITLNGTTVATKNNKWYAEYTYFATKDATFSMGTDISRGGDYVDITEE